MIFFIYFMTFFGQQNNQAVKPVKDTIFIKNDSIARQAMLGFNVNPGTVYIIPVSVATGSYSSNLTLCKDYCK